MVSLCFFSMLQCWSTFPSTTLSSSSYCGTCPARSKLSHKSLHYTKSKRVSELNRSNLKKEIWGLTNEPCSSSAIGGLLHAVGFMGCCGTSLERGRHPTSRSSRSQQDVRQWREMESPLRRRTAASIPWTATEAAELRASVDGVDSEARTGTLSQPDRRCPARPPCPAAAARPPAAGLPGQGATAARPTFPAWPRICRRLHVLVGLREETGGGRESRGRAGAGLSRPRKGTKVPNVYTISHA